MAQGGRLAPVGRHCRGYEPSIAQAIGMFLCFGRGMPCPAACCTDNWHWGILLFAAGCRETPADFGRSSGSDHGRRSGRQLTGRRGRGRSPAGLDANPRALRALSSRMYSTAAAWKLLAFRCGRGERNSLPAPQTAVVTPCLGGACRSISSQNCINFGEDRREANLIGSVT